MADDFAGAVRRWTEKTERKKEKAVRTIALDLFSDAIKNTPVETGRLRGSWLPSIGTPASGEGPPDKTGGATIARASGVVAGAELGDVIYLVNNVEYAIYVENGTARMAPRRMAGLAVQRAVPIANRVIAQIAAEG